MLKTDSDEVSGFKIVIVLFVLLVGLFIFFSQFAPQRIFQHRCPADFKYRGSLSLRNRDIYVNVDCPAIGFIGLLPAG